MDNDLKGRNSLSIKILTLWMTLYVLIFIATSQFAPFLAIREKPVIWFGKTFLDLPDLTRIKFTGSGDTLFDYVTAFFNVILSLVLAAVMASHLGQEKKKLPAIIFVCYRARPLLCGFYDVGLWIRQGL